MFVRPLVCVIVDVESLQLCKSIPHSQIMIRSIFLYLDRTYAVPNASILSIWWVVEPQPWSVINFFLVFCDPCHFCRPHRDLGLELFGSCVISQEHVQRRIVKGVLALIQKERCVIHFLMRRWWGWGRERKREKKKRGTGREYNTIYALITTDVTRVSTEAC